MHGLSRMCWYILILPFYAFTEMFCFIMLLEINEFRQKIQKNLQQGTLHKLCRCGEKSQTDVGKSPKHQRVGTFFTYFPAYVAVY